MRRQGEVLPRSLIASQVWDMNFDSDTNVIDVAIRRLCAKKIDDDFEPARLSKQHLQPPQYNCTFKCIKHTFFKTIIISY